MRGERLDAVERCRLRNGGLQREPFVDDQRIVAIAGVEIVERRRALGHVAKRQRRERRHAVGHVVGGLILLCGQRRSASGRAGRRQKIEADVAQRAPAGAGGIGRVGPLRTGGGNDRTAAPARCVADRRAQRGARREDRIGIDVAADLAGDVGLARKRQRERDEGGLERAVGEDRARARRAGLRPCARLPPRAELATLSSRSASPASAAPASD